MSIMRVIPFIIPEKLLPRKTFVTNTKSILIELTEQKLHRSIHFHDPNKGLQARMTSKRLNLSFFATFSPFRRKIYGKAFVCYLLWLEALCLKQTFGHLRENFFASGGIGQKVLKLKLKLKLATRPLAANQTFLSIEKRKGRKGVEKKRIFCVSSSGLDVINKF